MKKELVKRSKFLSLVLRHNPSAAQVELDDEGWVKVETLLDGCAKAGNKMSIDELKEVVETNNKRRFAFSDDCSKIRASQGHSVDVDLKLNPEVPPDFLYHGTATRFLCPIQSEGLKKMTRQHVHLSANRETAEQVGGRHGEVVILTINTGLMTRDGGLFYRSANGVWLTDSVAVKYIDFKDEY